MLGVEDLNLIFVDVEATGRSPATGVMTQFGAVHYHTRQSFHGLLHDSEPDPDNPAKPRLVGRRVIDPYQVMRAFAEWVAVPRKPYARPIFISDNNGYDAMWITFNFDRYGIINPFGHSSRRISDIYSGAVGDLRQTQKWKQWRKTPHTHHPVDDAMGNVEAFATMLRLHAQSVDVTTVGWEKTEVQR